MYRCYSLNTSKYKLLFVFVISYIHICIYVCMILGQMSSGVVKYLNFSLTVVFSIILLFLFVFVEEQNARIYVTVYIFFVATNVAVYNLMANNRMP